MVLVPLAGAPKWFKGGGGGGENGREFPSGERHETVVPLRRNLRGAKQEGEEGNANISKVLLL